MPTNIHISFSAFIFCRIPSFEVAGTQSLGYLR